MSSFEPTPIEGAQECDECGGSGFVTVLGEEQECPECDGLGEWFE